MDIAIRSCPPCRSRGITLIEALVAVLVLSLGLLVVARLQPQWRADADVARQRSEAMRLAQQDLERVRFADDPGDTTRDIDREAAGSNTAYRLVRRIDRSTVSNAAEVSIVVGWNDRAGRAQSATLDSVVARVEPALSGGAAIMPPGLRITGPGVRAIQIPLDAKDLGDGRSVVKPAGAAEAWVFDNRSGALTQRCTGIAAAATTPELMASDLSECTTAVGMVVAGEIHFSGALPPAPEAANDAPLALSVQLALSGASPAIAPWCVTETVVRDSERYVAYRCAVVPPVGVRSWSGRTVLVPSGWTIGTGADDWRVCRYARDLDGSGAVDANAEHPAIYQNVDRALLRQNFLVVRGNTTCPAPADGRTAARLSTEPHQP